jgi:hypothetical protein
LNLPETVPELIRIIKKKKLYRGGCFQIAIYFQGKGDYTSDSYKVVAGTYKIASDLEGIYRNESGMWKYFLRNERGGEEWSQESYSENEACQKLLKYLIKQAKLWQKTRSVSIQFPERWFDTDEIDY